MLKFTKTVALVSNCLRFFNHLKHTGYDTMCNTCVKIKKLFFFPNILYLGYVVCVIPSVKGNHAYLQSDKAVVLYSGGSRFQYRLGHQHGDDISF